MAVPLSGATQGERLVDSPVPSPASTVNPHELMRLLTDLQVGIRKYSMYSGAHAIIPQVVASLTAQFHAVVREHDVLHIGVTKDEILYQGAPIAAGNPVIRELARMLNQLNVAGVTFRREIAEADVFGFLRVLAECRGFASPAEHAQAIERFCRDVPSIALQFITFRGAVKSRDGASETDAAGDAESPQLWRGLVNRLMTAELSDESRAVLPSEDAEAVDAEQLAAAINQLGLQRKAGEQSYERAIVGYLHEKAVTSTATSEQRAQMNQQLHRLFATLNPEVRQQIFRASLEPLGQDTTPAEALADALPAPMLVEILDQLQVANRNVSLPTFSLLKKFVTLAESNQPLSEALQAKLGDQKDLLQELLTKRADRTFYPAQYRALLDQEFSERSLSPTTSSPSAAAAEFEDGAVDHHLALVLLETLEAPIRSPAQYSQTVLSLQELIARGIGDGTSTVFNEAIAILGNRYATAADDEREYFRECVGTLFRPDLVHYLLGPTDSGQDPRQREAFTRLLEIIGPGLIPLLLDKLETEQNLKARKRLLGLLRDCGDAVVPPAIQRLRHPQWYVVRNMLLLLRDLVAVQAVPEIVRCLQHPSAQVRLAAFQTLGVLAPSGDTFLKALKQALDDDDPKVFRAAVTQIVSTPNPASIELAGRLLVGHSGGKRGAQQLALLRVIEQIGTSAMLPLLTSVARHHLLRFWTWRQTRSVRSAASRALGAIRRREASRAGSAARETSHERTLDALADTGNESSPETASETAEAIAHEPTSDPV
jgi:HEAT repeat protein